MNISVRPATPEEYARLGDITAAAYLAGDSPVTGPYSERLRDVAARAGDSEVLVAIDTASGTVVGGVAFALFGSPMAEVCREGEAEFRMLAVDPARQGHGVGEALVHACLDRARSRGCQAVTISTAERFARARHLYERMGFVRLPDRDRDLDQGLTLLAYRISLAPSP